MEAATVPVERGISMSASRELDEPWASATPTRVSGEASSAQWTSAPNLMAGCKSERIEYYMPPRRAYSRRELLADRWVNRLGSVLSWVGAPVLLALSVDAGDDLLKVLGFLASGVGAILMLNLSHIYHLRSWDWKNARKLLSLDHVGITAMIMGSYAPLMLQARGYRTLAGVWAMGFLGFGMEAYKLLSGRLELTAIGGWTWFDKVHLVRYLVMGWAVVVVAPTMLRVMPAAALWLIATGGLLYTLGVPFLVRSDLEFHMAIWHAMVLIASACFYCANIAIVGIAAQVIFI